jgi:hypothetical protein
MKLEFEIEETKEVLTLLVDRLADEAGLGKDDLAKLRRWNSNEMRMGGSGMRELHEKVNAEIERTFRTKKKSAIRKPDWK